MRRTFRDEVYPTPSGFLPTLQRPRVKGFMS
jgi:hypothetical protein